jgi:uncharacterized protein (TIGR00369 family)
MREEPVNAGPFDGEVPAEKAAEVRASFEASGLMRAMGATITELRPGFCRLEMPFSDAVSQQLGFFHGGAIGALADTAGGYAALTQMTMGAEVVTLEYKINFLRPAAGDRLIADGIVLRIGRSVLVARVDVHVEKAGRRVLCAASQQSLMAPRQAPGDAPAG